MLSDRDIRLAMTPEKLPPNLRHLQPLRVIPAPDDSQFQPCTIDLRLGNEFIYVVGVKDPETGHVSSVKRKVVADTFTLKQGQFVLAHTLEYIEVPPHLCVKVDGKSSLGRRGIMVHVTAGLIDPGFKGMITLELKNVGYDNMTLEWGQSICQIEVHRLSSPAMRPYGTDGLGSKYQFQMGATDAK